MDRRLVGIALVALGLVLAAIFLLANLFAFSTGGFGWKQILGVIVGVAAVVAGVVLLLGLERGGDAATPPRSNAQN
ncbi:MAG: hypothetical protein LC808_38995 [Actinobacteria bacterium]|nr:hypothetical protein [Actinomycetota bacterium]